MSAARGIRETLPVMRRRAGMTTQELSDAMGGFISRAVIANVESGRKLDLSVDWLVPLCTALNCSVVDLLPELESVMPNHAPEQEQFQRGLRVGIRAGYGMGESGVPTQVVGEWFGIPAGDHWLTERKES